MLEHGTMGTDHRLNAGYPVNGPETKKKEPTLEGDRQLKANKDEEQITLWSLYIEPCSPDLKKTPNRNVSRL